MNLQSLKRDVDKAVRGLLEAAGLEAGDILVLGCSTSEIMGKQIGSAGNMEVAQAVLEPILEAVRARDLYLAVQCCEHLNRALVVEENLWKEYRLERVEVMPVAHAGGACAAKAIEIFDRPALVEAIQAHAGMDIGSTLIGMHLRPVAVPIRIDISAIGEARLTLARTRPKYIGGCRAVYE